MTTYRTVQLDTNNATGDAFGRLRASQPATLFDSKQIFDNQPLFWDEELESGAGITSGHSADTASTVITSTLNTAGVFTRQTFESFNYRPGKSQLIYMTGILDRSGGGTGVQRGIGLYNDDNGLFFQDNEGTIEVVRRTNVTGSPVDNAVTQPNWNIDVMDGTGVSGITLDWSKTQIFAIDFEWLGVGRVRMAVNVAGVTYPVHEFLNANVLDKVYMSTPNLPLRYQMITTGSSPASTMECICSSVISEGGSEDLGLVRSASTAGTSLAANVVGTKYAVIGIRLKSAYIGSVVKILSAAIQIQTASDTGEWTLMLNPTVADASWTSAWGDLTNSPLQTAVGVTANTVTGGTQVGHGFAESGNAGAGSSGSTASFVDSSRYIGAAIDGTVDELVLCWLNTSGTNHNIEGSLTWREL